MNYLIHLKNEGLRDSTIEARDWQLKRLTQLGANLNDPESVKKAIANLGKSESYKLLLCIAYDGFARRNGISWTRPEYEQCDKIPFVPHEIEIDNLISRCGKKTATFLRLLKETAMRLGEAWQIEWNNFGSEKRTVLCQYPEKHSRARPFTISIELCQMLQSLPKRSQFIFSCSREPVDREDPKTHLNHMRRQKGLLGHQRRRTAQKLKNPRIAQINYHSLRHWKATELYHKTKDILHVMKFLGHRNIQNTLIYIDTERMAYPEGWSEDYSGKVATTREEKLQLIEAGFEFVSADPDGTQYFRKRK